MLYIIIALFIWASSFTAGKYAYTMFDPAMAVQIRFFIASAIALPLFLKSYPTIDKSLRQKLWGISLLMFPIGILVQFIGLSYTSASSAVVMIGAEPIMILILGFLLFKQKIAIYDWLLSVIAFLGIGLLVLGSQTDEVVNLFGLFLVFIAGMGFALSVHLAKNIMNVIDNQAYTAIILVQGAIISLPISLSVIKDWTIHFNWLGLLSVIYLGIGCSWLAYKLWNLGLNKTPAHISGMLIVLEPVFGVLIAFLFLGETMSLLTALGSILVIGSAILSTLIPIIKKNN
ncbi:DMT family transporter [Moraxella oblonga]|uniref:DMT family transporter n=1 Tax=Moraxella oblonga TaxID=200413 RepID=UPI00082A5871|nr:DMT family transporter [Moraxella oblonga]